MPDREKIIECLQKAKMIIETWVPMFEQYNTPAGIDDALTLLKEQETGHWIFLENCSNSGVYCSECNTKVFDNYPFKKKLSYFCPHCGTRMEGEIERR